MAIKELDPGERHTTGLFPWRVQLTGNAAGAVLRAVDQAGHESDTTVRLRSTEIVVMPEPRRLRLVAQPSDGGVFAPGTSIGVTLLTEGAMSSADQVLVSSVDVGALPSYEIATLEFATDRTVVSVPSGRRTAPVDVAEAVVTGGSGSGPRQLPPEAIDEVAHPWIQPGRYALRDAEQRGAVVDAPDGWSLVVDGSASMLELHQSGELERLVETASGVMIQWTGRWASASVAAGVTRTSRPAARHNPVELLTAAFEGTEPASGVALAAAIRDASTPLPPGGAVLVVTDGVPGDVEQITALVAEKPGLRVFVVVVGKSRFGVHSDRQGFDWWRDELFGYTQLAKAPNAVVVSLAPGADGAVPLGSDRAAELASALTAKIGVAA